MLTFNMHYIYIHLGLYYTTKIAPGLLWLQYVSVARYATNSIVLDVVGTPSSIPCDGSELLAACYDCPPEEVCSIDTSDATAFVNVNSLSLGANMACMLGIGVLFRTCAFIAVKHYSKFNSQDW